MSIPAILQQLQGNQMPNLQPIKQMLGMVRSASNPQAMLQSMMQSNPQLRQAMSVVQQSGGDPQRAFYALCQQRGVDPQKILDALK